MNFRRGGQRDERRRRVLIDEPDVEASEASGSASGRSKADMSKKDSAEAGSARRYTEAALSPRQPRVIDLIPTRWWTILVLFGAFLAGAAGIEALYGYLALGHTPLSVTQFPAIDLSVRGNVATWFSAAVLAACAVYGLLTYQIRRHRVDDYRGRYRMWCWVIPLLLLASVDQVADLQTSLRTALLVVSGIPDYSDALLVWVASIAVLTGAVGGRLLIEMRACRLASFLMLLCLGCLATVGATRVGWLLPEASVFRTMLVSGLTMGAHVALLMALFLNARHVHRDASGQVPVTKRAQRRPKKVRKAKPEQPVQTEAEVAPEPRRPRVQRKNGKVTRTDPAHTPANSKAAEPSKAASPAAPKGASKASGKAAGKATAAPAAERAGRKEKRRVTADASTAKVSAKGSLCEPDDDLVEEPRKLSKAERKRQRKQRRRQQQG